MDKHLPHPNAGVLSMSKLQMGLSPAGDARPRLYVKVYRRGRPPTPWTWVIYEDGQATPCQTASRWYRSAEGAWQVGQAMLALVVAARQPGARMLAAADVRKGG